MKTVIHRHAWFIFTDPFYPEQTSDGRAINPLAYERDLDPRADAATMPIFFDVYDWTASPLVCGMRADVGLSTYPDVRTLPADAPLMVIISGARQTGRDSLANLVAYKAEKTACRQALLCNVSLDSRDPVQNVVAIAQRMIDAVEYGSPGQAQNRESMAKQMRDRLDRAVQAQKGRSEATYNDVFRAFTNIMAALKLEILVKIEQGGTPDGWGRIYAAMRGCAGCIIIVTPDNAAAKTCYQALSTDAASANVCWVRAQGLDAARTREYVRAKLDHVRIEGRAYDPPLLPFTADAIDVLFQPGSGAANAKGPLTHPVGWIRQSLAAAVEDLIEELQDRYPGAGEPVLSHLPLAEITINAARVARARDKLNRGS